MPYIVLYQPPDKNSRRNRIIASQRKVIVASICTLLFVPVVFAQYSYQYSGERWTGNSVTYHINNDMQTIYATQADFENAIDSAEAQWNNAGAYFQFEKGADVPYDPGTEPPGTFQVGYITLINSDTTAYTSVTTVNGELSQVETYFNYQYEFAANPNSNQLDIWTEAAHEFGHWLSLLDEVTVPQDVMYEDMTYGDTSRRHLASDDQNGIIYIYGRENSTVNNDILQSEKWYGSITIAQKSDGSDFIYINNNSTIEIESDCTLTIGPNVTLEVESGSDLIEDGGCIIDTSDGGHINNIDGGIITGIGPNDPPAPIVSATIVGNNVVLSWSDSATPSISFYDVYKNGYLVSDNSPQSPYIDTNAVNSLPATYQVEATWSYYPDPQGSTYSRPLNVIAAPANINSNTSWSGAVYVNNNVTVSDGISLEFSLARSAGPRPLNRKVEGPPPLFLCHG